MNVSVPEIRLSKLKFQTEPAQQNGENRVEAVSAEAAQIRAYLLSRGNSAIADRGFRWLMVLCALSIFGIVVLIATELVVRSKLAWEIGRAHV